MKTQIEIDPKMVDAFNEIMKAPKEMCATMRISRGELATLRISLEEFEREIVAERLANMLAHYLHEALVAGAHVRSADTHSGLGVEYGVRMAFLSESEWTLLHKIRNTLLTEVNKEKLTW